ncbi:MAG: hypothetical protein ACLRFL_03180 [Clostridia bacterium]
MGRQNKKLISRMTDKAMENDLRNHIAEVELLNMNLNNLQKFLRGIKIGEHETNTTINTYQRAIDTFDQIGNKYSVLKTYMKECIIAFQEYDYETLRPLLMEYIRKCRNLNDRLERLEVTTIEDLFKRTPAAKEIQMTSVTD